MTFKTVTCAIVMGSALMFGGAAYADTMVGSSTVTDVDLPAVQARCDALNADGAPVSLTENTDDNTSSEGAGDTGDTNSATGSGMVSTSEVPGATAAATTSINLDSVTLEQCKTAGLIK